QILIKNGALPNMNTEHILPSPIHYASGILEFTDCLEKVFQQFSDVNLLDHKGKTPLPWAAELGNHMATKLLLQKNANVNARNKKGETPLHLAVKKGFPLITQILISNRADCNAKDKR